MYRIDTTEYQEDRRVKLGGGSEGTVYAFPADPLDCVKLFHPPEKGNKEAATIAAYRARKIEGILKLPITLPEQFILPKAAAHDANGGVTGFLMRRVPAHYGKIKLLLESRFRTDYQIGLREISRLFADILDDLALVHTSNIVVGDINAGSIMIDPKLARAWVDADSWSYPGFPSLATTELFCHPDLYPNIGGSGTFVRHQPHHDRFSIAIMYVLMAIHGAHPFRMGLHPQYSSLQDRTRQKLTIFDQSVQYPAYLPKREILSDELINTLLQVLTRTTNEPIPTDLLRTFAHTVVVCANCGAQYHPSRKHCPQCHTTTAIDIGKLTKLTIDDAYFTTRGTILFVQSVGTELRVIVRVGNSIEIVCASDTNQSHTIRTSLAAIPGAAYRFFDTYLAVCTNPFAPSPVHITVYRLNGTRLDRVTQTSTGSLENAAALFDTSSRFLYRTAGNTLLCSRVFGATTLDEPVMQVFGSQTWFTVDHAPANAHEVIFGYDRALRDWQWFVVRGNKDGDRFEHHIAPVTTLRSGEKLVDFAVYFNADSVLLVRSTLYRGIGHVRYAVIGFEGTVRLERMLTSKDTAYAYWEHVSGKLYQATGVVHVMPDGLVKHTFATDTYELLVGTKNVAAQSDILIKLDSGVGIIKNRSITRFSKKK